MFTSRSYFKIVDKSYNNCMEADEIDISKY